MIEIGLDDFSQVTMDDRDLFLEHYHRYPQQHSDNSFVNMVCWNHYAYYEYAQLRDSIILSSTTECLRTFRGPIGPPDREVLDAVMRLSVEEGGKEPFMIFDEPMREFIGECYPDLPVHPDRSYFDYIYRAEELSTLKGRDYISIRKQINRFMKKCNHTIEQVTDDNLDEINEFLIRWCDWKECEKNTILKKEKEAVIFAVDNFHELGIGGMLIRRDGKMSALAIFEYFNPDTAIVHFEKALPGCEGIYKMINRETAGYLFGKGITYINRECDMGVEGLRTAKMRYRPDHFAPIYYVKKSDLIEVI